MKLILPLFAVVGHFVSTPGYAAVPVIDPPIPTQGQAARVTPNIPVGKTLLFPITASDADGDALSYKVTSSNPAILARVKTGNPKLVLNLSHADGGADDPAFAGTMEFMLFRDWLPVSAGFVAGMAQAGFYDNVLFHRIADLGGGAGTTGFIFQGGDPLGTGSGGPGMTASDPQTSWKFQNEFHNGTIFSGRGQLAMANAGTNTGYSLGSGGTLIVPDYRDSNGSQFFITDGQPRHLDFKHNIFGQMLRGWELLPKFRATKTSSSRPDLDLKILTATIQPNETDAVLVLSAKARGSSLITVTVRDPGGASAKRSFIVRAVRDESNCNPFVRRMDPVATPKDIPAVFALDAVDLEFDYLDVQHSMLPQSASIGPKGTLLASSGRVVQMQPTAGYTGFNNLGFSIRQYDIGVGGFTAISDYTNAIVSSGDRAARGEGVSIDARPAIPLANVVVAKLHDLDPAGVPGNFTANVNWGDGTPLTTATLARDTTAPGAGLYVALGSHTYAKAGVYTVIAEFSGNAGARASARSIAEVSVGTLRASGGAVESNSGRIVNRVVATFTDALPALASGYTARIDWGDGLVSDGAITRDAESGKFLVRGTHGYRDSEPFAVSVRIHKKTDVAANDALAWTTIVPRFKASPHLPPFPHPKLTIAWNSGPTKSQRGRPGPNYQVTYNGTFVIINTGNRTLGVSKLRFWLSDDRTLNKTGPQRDRVVLVNGQPELNIIPFPAGAGGSGAFALTMPKGQSSGGKYLLSEADYSDPIANDDGSDKVNVTGPLPPTILLSKTSGLETTEAGGTATFTVVLDTRPTTPKIAITSIAAGSPVTINTAMPHGITSGSEVLIAGVTGSTPEMNGVFIATVTDTDTFTIPLAVTTAGTGGTVQLNPQVVIPIDTTLATEGTPAASVAITSITAGTPTTGNPGHDNTNIQTATPHGLVTGDQVIFSNVTGNDPVLSAITHSVGVIDATTFTIPVTLTTAGTGGRVQNLRRRLVFTAENWSVPQTVTVTGVDDPNIDGDKLYRIQVKAAISADLLYNNVIAGDVLVFNADNDAP
ncbi:MAG: peptidylprolyl isomerase [Chthoniobacteraceae bacterium]